jgi:hypothetical protein
VYTQVLHESINVFIDPPLEVQLWSKWNYVINMHNQPLNNSILKNLCQVKQETHMNKKLNINLVQPLWLDLDQERIDQVQLLSVGYLWKQLIIGRRFSRMILEDMKWYVTEDGSWKRINKDLTMMNHASEKSKWESWHQGISIESIYEVTWRSNVEIDHMVWSTPSHNL